MAELLKNIYGPAFFKGFTSILAQVIPNFREAKFLELIYDNWEQLELKQRMRHIARALKTVLFNDYTKDIDAIGRIILEIKKGTEREQIFEYMFFPEFVEAYGINDFDVSIKAIETITGITSCEYAIRPFIIKYPEETMEQMLLWSKHENKNLRRLSSEGCRPRLPWAMALPALKKNPAPILPVLENLKNDSSEYVRRSVANNLNDIARDNPNVVVEIAKNWKGVSQATDWIIKHGCRTLLKKANNDIYDLLGLLSEVKILVTNLRLDKHTISIGDALLFSFDLENKEDAAVSLRIEYAIYYVKSNGRQSRKLFKITENRYENNRTYSFKRKQSFKDMTTRRHYKGEHKIAIVVNGREVAHKDFTLE